MASYITLQNNFFYYKHFIRLASAKNIFDAVKLGLLP